MKLYLSIQLEFFVCRLDFKTTILAFFLAKNLNYTVFILNLQKLSTFTIANITTSTGTNITLQTNLKCLRTYTTCRAFTLDCQYGNSNMNFSVNLYCQDTMAWGKICVHKRLLNLSTEAIINVLNDRPSVRSALFILRNKRNVFLECDRRIFLNKHKNRFKTLLELSSFREGIARDQKLLMSMNGKRMMKIVTNVFNANDAAMFWVCPLSSKNRKFWCLAVMPLIVSSKRQVVTTETKNHLIFWKLVTANHNQAHRNFYWKTQKHCIWGIIVSNSHCLTRLTWPSFSFYFFTLSKYSKATWFSQFPYWVVLNLDLIQLLWL